MARETEGYLLNHLRFLSMLSFQPSLFTVLKAVQFLIKYHATNTSHVIFLLARANGLSTKAARSRWLDIIINRERGHYGKISNQDLAVLTVR